MILPLKTLEGNIHANSLGLLMYKLVLLEFVIEFKVVDII